MKWNFLILTNVKLHYWFSIICKSSLVSPNLSICFLILFTRPSFLFWSRKRYPSGFWYGIAFVTIFQIITASFLAVAVMADTRPFLKLILWKKSLRGVLSFKFPIALAAFLRAILSLLLPLPILLDNTFPPLTLLLG